LAVVRRLQQIVSDSRRYILRTLRKSVELGISYFDVKPYKHIRLDKGQKIPLEQVESSQISNQIIVVHENSDMSAPNLFDEEDLLNPIFSFLNEEIDIDLPELSSGDNSPRRDIRQGEFTYVDVSDHIARNLEYQRYKSHFGSNAKFESDIVSALLLRGGIEQNPGPRVKVAPARKLEREIDQLEGLQDSPDFKNYQEGIIFFKGEISTDGPENISFCVNDLEKYFEAGSWLICRNQQIFEAVRAKYEYYRIGNVRTEITVLEGKIKIIQAESLYDCSKFEGYGSFSDVFVTNKYVEEVSAGHMYKRYVEGYYFAGCREVYDSTYDNSKYGDLDKRMFINIILDADNVASKIEFSFALRVQFFSRIYGDDSNMSDYFKLESCDKREEKNEMQECVESEDKHVEEESSTEGKEEE